MGNRPDNARTFNKHYHSSVRQDATVIEQACTPQMLLHSGARNDTVTHRHCTDTEQTLEEELPLVHQEGVHDASPEQKDGAVNHAPVTPQDFGVRFRACCLPPAPRTVRPVKPSIDLLIEMEPLLLPPSINELVNRSYREYRSNFSDRKSL